MRRLARWCAPLLNKSSVRRSAQNGDTIVEVLIALVIVSSVLAGAFLVAQRSAGAVQDSKERGEALQLLQSQVETVRALALQQSDQTTGVYSGSPKFFCIDTTDHQKGLPDGVAGDSLKTDDFGNYTGCQFGPGNRYNVAVWYNPKSAGGNDTFSFLARWDNANGNRSQEVLNYRIFPGIVIPPTQPPPVCQPTQIAILVDDSESTQQGLTVKNVPAAETRHEIIKRLLTGFVQNTNIGNGNKAGIIGFNATAMILQPMTDQQQALLNAINNLPIVFGTAYVPPLQKVTSLWDPGFTGKKVILFMSDGENWQDRVFYGDINAPIPIAQSYKDSGTDIFTVGVGKDSKFDVLRQMAGPNAAWFSSYADEASLQRLFQDLAAEIGCIRS